jgi:hypothetical protein
MAMSARSSEARPVAPVDENIIARISRIDQRPLFRYRLNRLRAELRKWDFAASVLSDR